ncbi:hypothetical protein NC980_25460, partial [Leptolyngbya sp. AS-A5]
MLCHGCSFHLFPDARVPSTARRCTLDLGSLYSLQIRPSRNPDSLPRSFDVEEMRKDLELFQDLNQILMSLTQLQDMVNDTCMVVGSEAYTAALTVYDYAKKSGVNANGMEPIVAEMREHFRRSRKPKPSQEKSTVN